jgi:hypothetical protein
LPTIGPGIRKCIAWHNRPFALRPTYSQHLILSLTLCELLVPQSRQTARAFRPLRKQSLALRASFAHWCLFKGPAYRPRIHSHEALRNQKTKTQSASAAGLPQGSMRPGLQLGINGITAGACTLKYISSREVSSRQPRGRAVEKPTRIFKGARCGQGGLAETGFERAAGWHRNRWDRKLAVCGRRPRLPRRHP